LPFKRNLQRYSVEVYEEVAKASMDNNLLKFSVKGYLLNAVGALHVGIKLTHGP
jgi:hypothetical protein